MVTMLPTETLMKEHRLIERILEVLESVAHQTLQNRRIDPTRAGDILTFLKEFADRCHHGKEEKYLFPMLATHGYGPEMGPVAVMLNEHEQGRAFIRAMAAAVDTDDAASPAAFARAADGYVMLLSGHIQKEDGILFKIADQVLSPEDQQAVTEGFERVEREEMGPGAHERLHALADRILAGAIA
jgi:hemerythrin-like domain-containing protein